VFNPALCSLSLCQIVVSNVFTVSSVAEVLTAIESRLIIPQILCVRLIN
jgi:hypothetical protein